LALAISGHAALPTGAENYQPNVAMGNMPD